MVRGTVSHVPRKAQLQYSGRSEDPFLLNYDASRGVVASASHSPGHLMPRTYAPQFISGLGYQGTNWRPFDAFRRHYPNATLHNRSDTGSGPSNAPTPGLAVAHDLYPSWTQSEIPYRGQSFMFPYMTDGTISDSLTPEHPIATENGATAASLTNPIVLTFNAEMSDKNYPISPLSFASMSGANPSLIVSAPFKQQPDPSKSFFTNTVPPYEPSSSDALEVDLNDATPNGSLDDVAVYTPQSGGTVRRRRGRNQAVVLRRRKYPGLAKYFCDDCASDNDFTTAGALNSTCECTNHVLIAHRGCRAHQE